MSITTDAALLLSTVATAPDFFANQQRPDGKQSAFDMFLEQTPSTLMAEDQARIRAAISGAQPTFVGLKRNSTAWESGEADSCNPVSVDYEYESFQPTVEKFRTSFKVDRKSFNGTAENAANAIASFMQDRARHLRAALETDAINTIDAARFQQATGTLPFTTLTYTGSTTFAVDETAANFDEVFNQMVQYFSGNGYSDLGNPVALYQTAAMSRILKSSNQGIANSVNKGYAYEVYDLRESSKIVQNGTKDTIYFVSPAGQLAFVAAPRQDWAQMTGYETSDIVYTVMDLLPGVPVAVRINTLCDGGVDYLQFQMELDYTMFTSFRASNAEEVPFVKALIAR